MNLSKIISISGMSGLFKVIAQTKNGLLVESFAEKKRFPVQSQHRFSVLENISIYLVSGETTPLSVLLKKIYDRHNGNPAPDPKSLSDEEMKKYFSEILPDYDKEKVHLSDMRKIIAWYNLMQATDVFTQKEEEQKNETAVLDDEQNKKPEPFRPQRPDLHGKHLHTSAGAGKKTFGVRKVGEG